MRKLPNTIKAAELIGNSFPTNEGEKFAEILITDENIDWDGLEIDLRGCRAAVLISGFFNAFFQKIHEDAPMHLNQAKAIKWQTNFPFQDRNIAQWVSWFKPHD